MLCMAIDVCDHTFRITQSSEHSGTTAPRIGLNELHVHLYSDTTVLLVFVLVFVTFRIGCGTEEGETERS